MQAAPLALLVGLKKQSIETLITSSYQHHHDTDKSKLNHHIQEKIYISPIWLPCMFSLQVEIKFSIVGFSGKRTSERKKQSLEQDMSQQRTRPTYNAGQNLNPGHNRGRLSPPLTSV